jgi:Inovirus Coat protein B
MNKFARLSLYSFSTLGAVGAMAAVPAEVTAALSTIQADALTVAGVVLVAVIAIFAFKFLRKGL